MSHLQIVDPIPPLHSKAEMQERLPSLQRVMQRLHHLRNQSMISPLTVAIKRHLGTMDRFWLKPGL